MTERLDAFMARANAAYYATHNPFADFTTSPEISQVFGEILGLWAAVTWQLLGSPAPIVLAEAGPGRGTLMADALRALAHDAESVAAHGRAVLASEDALRLARANREAGLSSEQPVLAAEAQAAQARIGLLEARALRLQDAVALFVALGGGWWASPALDTAAPAR